MSMHHNKPISLKNFNINSLQEDVKERVYNTALLERPYTDIQTMSRALEDCDRQYPTDAYKDSKKWNEKPKTERTWSAF